MFEPTRAQALRPRPAGRRLLPLAALPVLLALGGCAAPAARPAPAPAAASPAAPADAGPEITRMMEASTEAWNRGDLAGFLLPYLDSPGTTFVTSTGLLHGKAAIEARYRSNYWKDGAPADRLRFVDLDVRVLGPASALATGRYQLFTPAGEKRAEGPFSLVLVHTPAGWRIVHDHSS